MGYTYVFFVSWIFHVRVNHRKQKKRKYFSSLNWSIFLGFLIAHMQDYPMPVSFLSITQNPENYPYVFSCVMRLSCCSAVSLQKTRKVNFSKNELDPKMTLSRGNLACEKIKFQRNSSNFELKKLPFFSNPMIYTSEENLGSKNLVRNTLRSWETRKGQKTHNSVKLQYFLRIRVRRIIRILLSLICCSFLFLWKLKLREMKWKKVGNILLPRHYRIVTFWLLIWNLDHGLL